MQSGDRARLEVLMTQAAAARRDNRLEDATRDLRDAVELCRRAGDDDWLARALAGLGQIERNLGRTEPALACYSEAAGLCRALDDRQRLAHNVRHIADIHVDAGNIAEAEPHYEEALAIYRNDERTRDGDLANAIRGFAVLKERQGERQEAKRLWEEARDLYAKLQIEPGVAESSRRIAALT